MHDAAPREQDVGPECDMRAQKPGSEAKHRHTNEAQA